MPYMPANYGQPVTPQGGQYGGIQGQLPFGQANVGGMFSGDLAGSYQSAYNTALGQNQANYNNILSGYQQTLQQQQTGQAAISKGYNQLYNQVLGGIQGIGQSQAQAIADQYAQASGQSQQDLINRGLGNSTVLSSVQRGNQLDKSKADVALANQIAQLTAGYQSQLGGAGLNYANQANMQNAAQQNQQLNWMNSIQAQYPNAQGYSQLYQQQGAIGQANADRAQQADQFKQQLAAAQRGAGGVGGGQIMRSGGGGVGGGFGPAGASGGQMSTVTPFGLGGAGAGGGAGANFGNGYGGAQPVGNAGQYLAGLGAGYGQQQPQQALPGQPNWFGGAWNSAQQYASGDGGTTADQYAGGYGDY